MNYTTSIVRLASPTKGEKKVCRDEIEIRCFETQITQIINRINLEVENLEHLLICIVVSIHRLRRRNQQKNRGLAWSSPAQKAIVVDLSRAFQPQITFRPSILSPFERDPKSPIAIQSIHDSRFKSSTFFHGSSTDTHNFLFFFFFPRRSIENRNFLAGREDLDGGNGRFLSVVRLQCEPR